jgi:hypothetical protein
MGAKAASLITDAGIITGYPHGKKIICSLPHTIHEN